MRVSRRLLGGGLFLSSQSRGWCLTAPHCSAPSLSSSSPPVGARRDGLGLGFMGVEEHLVSCQRRYHSHSTASAVTLWTCTNKKCGVLNFSLQTNCHRCGTVKPTRSSWICSDCGASNRPGVLFCVRCASEAKAATTWKCPGCTKTSPVVAKDGGVQHTCTHCGYDITRISPAAAAESTSAEAPQNSDPAADTTAKSSSNVVAAARAQTVLEDNEPLPGPPGFDWMCREKTCGTVNGGDDECCGKCQVKLIPSRWTCQSCAAVNHRTRTQCFDCGDPIKVSWTCAQCTTKSSVYEKECRQCSAPQPPVVPTKFPHQGGGADFRSGGGGGGGRQSGKGGGDWVCPLCSALNFSYRDKCFQCDASLSGDGTSVSGPGETVKLAVPVGDSNWVCHSCSSTNFRTRTTCWQCNAECLSGAGAAKIDDEVDASVLPNIAKEGFQQSDKDEVAPGQKKQWTRITNLKDVGDWVCPKCFTKNFKSRKECFKCNSPKTLLTQTKIRVRTPSKI
jgi:hypothetical protein